MIRNLCLAASTLAILLVLAANPVTTAAEPSPPVTLEPYTFETAGGEKVEAELGKLTVPENRSRKDSRSLELAFVRFPSTASKPGSPIVYLAGGPGGSGIRTAQGSRFPLFMALREFGDVIAFDQRGTGMSGSAELNCDDRYLIPFDRPLDRAEAGKIVAKATRGCLDRMRQSGIDVSAYNTRESAADLDALRRALGAKKITLWGISYGTHLALATMKDHGRHVDRAILAGLEALHHSYKLPSDQQALMEEIARLVAADPTVRESVPDLLASLRRLLAELERQPRTVQLTLPGRGTTLDVTVGKFDLQFALSNLLRGPESFAVLPDVVSRMERGDWLPLAMAAARTRSGEGLHGMSVAMDCASGADPGWLKRIAAESRGTLLGDAINFPYPEVCQGLDIPDLGSAFRKPVQSSIPTLLISGTLDGRTPVRNGEEVLADLKNARHLIIDGAGHSDPLFLSSPKILEAMRDFLAGRKLASTRIGLPPVEFIAPRTLARLENPDRYTGTYRIGDGSSRQVVNAGGVLYTIRDGGQPFPIRPVSQTEFFYEGQATTLRFETDAAGRVTGMVVFHEGKGPGEPATKID